MKIKKISVVLPCYNEEKSAARTIDHLRQILSQIGVAFEIIAVSDGSTDGTIGALIDLGLGNLNVIELKKNQGKGAALKEGVHRAKGDIIFFHDADLVLPLEMFASALADLQSFDAVFASKNLPQSDFPRPSYRRFFYRLFNLLVRAGLRLPLTDTQSGFKSFRQNVLKSIVSKTGAKKFDFDLEIAWLTIKEGYRVKEIPFRGRSIRGRSHFISANALSDVSSVLFWTLKKIVEEKTGFKKDEIHRKP